MTTTIDNKNNVSIFDEKNKNLRKESSFVLKYDPDLIFKALMKLSLSQFKNINWRNYPKLEKGMVFKSKVGFKHYSLIEYEINRVYEIYTVIDDVQYYTRFEVAPKKHNRTKIEYSQSLKFFKTIQGFKGNVAKMNFNKKWNTNNKQLVIAINQIAKDIYLEEQSKTL